MNFLITIYVFFGVLLYSLFFMQSFLWQLLQGIAYCHQHRVLRMMMMFIYEMVYIYIVISLLFIIDRDLKPQNLLINMVWFFSAQVTGYFEECCWRIFLGICHPGGWIKISWFWFGSGVWYSCAVLYTWSSYAVVSCSGMSLFFAVKYPVFVACFDSV